MFAVACAGGMISVIRFGVHSNHILRP